MNEIAWAADRRIWPLRPQHILAAHEDLRQVDRAAQEPRSSTQTTAAIGTEKWGSILSLSAEPQTWPRFVVLIDDDQAGTLQCTPQLVDGGQPRIGLPGLELFDRDGGHPGLLRHFLSRPSEERAACTKLLWRKHIRAGAFERPHSQ